MKMTVVLADPEERLAVDCDARDRRYVERAIWKIIGLPPGSGDMAKISAAYPDTYTAILGYCAAKRAGLDMPFAEFENRIVEVEGVELEDDAMPDPTPTGHGPG